MSNSPLARFARVFFKRFGATLRESIFDKVIVAATIVYFLVLGIATKHWEFITPIVWGVCAIIVYHAIDAARAVNREIKAESTSESLGKELPVYGPDGKFVRVDVADIPPRFFRAQLFGFALLISGLCCFASWSAFKFSRRSSEEAPSPPPTPPVSVSLQMNCEWNHLPIHIPEASTIHVLRVHPGLLKLNPNFDMGLFEDISSTYDKATDWPFKDDGKWMGIAEQRSLMVKGIMPLDFVDNCKLQSYTTGTLDEIAPTLLVDTPDKKRHVFPVPFDPLTTGTSFTFYIVNMCSRGTLPVLVQWDDYARVRVLGESKVRTVRLNFQKRRWPPNGLMFGAASSFIWNQNNTCEWNN